MDFFDDHKKLFSSAVGLFLCLTLVICILPALDNQRTVKPLPDAQPLTAQEMRGKKIYIREGCVACHTQQVRNVDMDAVFGSRPSLSADYALNSRISWYQNTATLMGSERTGPDLTTIGERQPSVDWQMTHLYNPRAVQPASIMPSFKWMFDVKQNPTKDDVVVNLPEEFTRGINGKVVASQDAKDLVAYLLSLKQVKLPDGTAAPDFIYKKEEKAAAGGGAGGDNLPDGGALFTQHCASCHQATGKGLPGAFPSLVGNEVVLGDDLELYVSIIMNGYDALVPQFGVMPAVGATANLKPEEVAAIMNHERTSWGNSADKVTADQVKELMDKVKK